MFVPSKAFRIFLDDCCLILLKKQKVCAHENNFHFLPESDKIPIPLAVDQYTNFSGHPNFSEFLRLHKYSRVTGYYRLFCFWQILFFVCSLLILMNLWVVSGVWAIEKLAYSRFNTNINKEWVHYSTLKWSFVFFR